MEAYQRLELELAESDLIGIPEEHLPGHLPVVCSSGTAALHLACEALSTEPPIREQQIIVVPNITMIACPRAVVMSGYKVAFVDCNPTGMMYLDHLQEILRHGGRSIKAVMYVALYGRSADRESIYSMVPDSVSVIEDLAEAHGVAPHPRCFAACWSFYRNKIVAGEEGGAVWFGLNTTSAQLRQETLERRSLGFTENHDYWHRPRGYNYRLSNANAQLILESLGNFEENFLRRCEAIEAYDRLLKPHHTEIPRESPWVYDWIIQAPMKENRFLQFVQAVNSRLKAGQLPGIRSGFKPLRLQEEFCLDNYARFDYQTEQRYPTILLPLADPLDGRILTGEDISIIVSVVLEMLRLVRD